MARIRSIHPGLFTDEAYMALSLAARELIKGLWIESDDQGVFQWKPLTLKARIFPADNIDVSAVLSELEAHNFVRSYEHDGQKLGAVRNFRKFQRPKFPNAAHYLPDGLRSYVGLTESITEMEGHEPPSLPPVAASPPPKSSQMERRMEDGEEKKDLDGARKRAPPATRGTRLADDWHPDEDDRAFARSLNIDPEVEAERFRDYWLAQPGQRGIKANWRATWRNWCRRAREFSGASGGVRRVDRAEQSAARVRSKAVALARSAGGFRGPLEPPENPGNAGANRAEDRGSAGPLLDADADGGRASGDDGGLDSGAGGSAAVGPGRGVLPLADRPGNGAAETAAGGHQGTPARLDDDLEIPDFLRRPGGARAG